MNLMQEEYDKFQKKSQEVVKLLIDFFELNNVSSMQAINSMLQVIVMLAAVSNIDPKKFKNIFYGIADKYEKDVSKNEKSMNKKA